MMRFSKLVPVILLALWVVFSGNTPENSLPKGFVYVSDYIPNVILDIRYFQSDNFVGKRVNGYEKPVAILTHQSAQKLQLVAKEVAKKNLRLKIFDGYRPQRAVDHFTQWALDLSDTLTKAKYYPEVHKSDLFKLEYIASKSGHSRGSTVDLTLADENGIELDMGSSWDYFGSKSWPSDTTISELAQQNRNYLRSVMLKNGFRPYHKEWWHFTLVNEPYTDMYFDFVVE